MANPGFRLAASTQVHSRRIRLYISDRENKGYARISNGDPTDKVWIDRSYDGGETWEDEHGPTRIPAGSREAQTEEFDIGNRRIGTLRAWGKAGNRREMECTVWSTSAVNAAATGLMEFYDGRLFHTTGWWNGANCLQALLDYSKLTGIRTFRYVIQEVYEGNRRKHSGNFKNEFMDDTLWWGLAWLRAYELTHDEQYLATAMSIADYCYQYKDGKFGGGLWWSQEKSYKNAITNELFIKLAAALHNRIPEEREYLRRAKEIWTWFKGSGMINEMNLINDELTAQGRNNGEATWTYNQGVILGGLVELWKATDDQSYLRQARKIADAVMDSEELSTGHRVLKEFGSSGGDHGPDEPSFKGVFVRNLGELNRVLRRRPYTEWLGIQADSNWNRNRNEDNQFGFNWEGRASRSNVIDRADAARQHSALDVFVAVL